MHYVIIGAGPAGINAAEQLRKLDSGSRITVLGDEPEAPYSRMALPYYLIKQIAENGTHLRKKPEHFESLSIDVLNRCVESVDGRNKCLRLNGGESLNFGKLLIASGSRPVRPTITGIDLPGIYNCWTLADGRQIAAQLKPGARVVLMGAGFIGCIILEALVKCGAQLTVVEMGDRMVPRMMNEKAGGLIKQWCLDKGVAIHTSTTITAFEPDRDGLRVRLDSGRTLEADFVVSAAGVKANIDFLKGSDIETDQGVLVDRYLETNIKDIFAAGDVAQGLDFSTGDYTVQAIQPTAVDHGLLAAKNMAGMKQLPHRGNINMNVLDTMGLIACSFGLWMGAGQSDSVELYNPDRYRYLNLQFDEDRVVGATAVGLTQHVGVLRGLIQSRIKLGEWKQRLKDDPTRIMEAYLACTQPIGFNAGVL